MKKTLSILCIALLAISSWVQLQGEILETNEIQTVLNHVEQDSFVFFNTAGTLYVPANTLADCRWRKYFSNRVKQTVSNPEIAQKIIDRVKALIVQCVPKKPVEEISSQLIADLQKQQIVVLGITNKQVKPSNHLLKLGIKLEETLSYLKLVETEEQNQYTFAHGILFTNKQAEGASVLSFLNQIPLRPSKIVMVDNSRHSLESVQEALASTTIAFTGIRYGAADALKENFDPTLGTIEFVCLMHKGRVISDAEALAFKSSEPTSDLQYELMLDEIIRLIAQSSPQGN
jgi:hypothetical protein